jgi:hypothetical protein
MKKYLSNYKSSPRTTKTNCLNIDIMVIPFMRATLFSSMVFVFMFTSCRVKYGCPSSGKNVGAERLSAISNDPQSTKKIKKEPKYRLGKY